MLPVRPANRQTKRRVPQVPDAHTRQLVVKELRVKWRVDPYTLEQVAEKLHRNSKVLFPFAPALELASGLKFAVEESQRCGCGLSGLHPKILHVQRHRDVRKWNLRVLHELAHAILREEYPDHSHGDVWALTLMLACPRSAYRHIELARHVPQWALALRQVTARAIRRAA